MKIAVTQAQSILLRLGVPYELVTLGHRKGRLPSFTKKGPGRKHIGRKEAEEESPPLFYTLPADPLLAS